MYLKLLLVADNTLVTSGTNSVNCVLKKKKKEAERMWREMCRLSAEALHSDKAHKILTQKLLATRVPLCSQPSQGRKISLQFGILHLQFLQL